MADFKESLDLVFKQEFKNKQDALHKNKTENGLTFCGIYEKANRGFLGWKKIKEVLNNTKDLKKASEILFNDEKLLFEVREFYKKNYWAFDLIKSQKIANILFSFCVNLGFKRALILAQQILKQKQDGVVSLDFIKVINNTDENSFIKNYKIVLKKYYENLTIKNHKLKIYLQGWINRVDFFKGE